MLKIVYFLLFVPVINIAQNLKDSVLVYYKLGSIPKFEVITNKDGKYIIEYYSYFKGYYSKNKEIAIDSLKVVKKNNFYYINKKKYKLYSICDSNVTNLRNSYSYYQMLYSLYSEFNTKYKECNFKEKINNSLSNYDYYKKLCPENYLKFEENFKKKLTYLADSIYENKNKRMKYFMENIDSLNLKIINSFLTDIDNCKMDFEILFCLINYKTEMFIKGISNLSEKDFYSLKYLLFNFSKNDKKVIIKKIKETNIESDRIKALIKILRYP
ncbi:MAG: hypothetical protein HPY79_02955 [Bacteroidales bacterium]|nr:hypothetical protein [Bacteroidales bacterium]